MKRVDFVGGIHPICASSCAATGSCGAGKTSCGGACGAPSVMTNYSDVPVIFLNNANAILMAVENGGR